MQVKQEFCNSITDEPPQDMLCSDNKTNSPYSLWADYFDTFPVLTEFDLRAGVGSTTTSTTSSSSASSESWSSPGSGSPFSDCGQEDSAFIDDHSVPTSVIDEIVQTLKMDGYNFDHLSDDISIDSPTTNNIVKQDPEITTNQSCFMSHQPVYTSLMPSKSQQYDSRKYNNNNPNVLSAYEHDKQWCVPTSLPTIGMPMQQQHAAQQQHATQQQHTTQQQHCQPSLHSQSQAINNYVTGVSETSSNSLNSQVFFSSCSLPAVTNIQQYKLMNTSPVTIQPPPLIQTCEKATETKPRRRRSQTSGEKPEKPHVCKECGASFKLSANLKQHQVIHTGEKPFSCEICKAMFTRLSSLKTHHRLHTGEKPHICPFCSAAFADRSAMKAHKRIHTGERPYKCAVCSTSFTQLSHLNAHKRTHTGEKPYACSICGTTFKQLGHLKRHEKSHVCNRM